MLLDENYVRQSLELHLFFARIMKEHALFPADRVLREAKHYLRLLRCMKS